MGLKFLLSLGSFWVERESRMWAKYQKGGQWLASLGSLRTETSIYFSLVSFLSTTLSFLLKSTPLIGRFIIYSQNPSCSSWCMMLLRWPSVAMLCLDRSDSGAHCKTLKKFVIDIWSLKFPSNALFLTLVLVRTLLWVHPFTLDALRSLHRDFRREVRFRFWRSIWALALFRLEFIDHLSIQIRYLEVFFVLEAWAWALELEKACKQRRILCDKMSRSKVWKCPRLAAPAASHKTKEESVRIFKRRPKAQRGGTQGHTA